MSPSPVSPGAMNPGLGERPSVLVTGAGGYVGRQLIQALSRSRDDYGAVVSADIRETPSRDRLAGIDYITADIRSPDLQDILQRYAVNTVVHLATIVTPGRKSDREFEYSVDVLGTQNLLWACLGAGVAHVIVTSSGAAYGYHADNPPWLDEEDPLRGNQEFAYSHHKRLVEEMLARYREEHPHLKQLVFRPGTILGNTADNQITALFRKRIMIGIRGAASPFVFIWDQDVVACILKGVREGLTGIYNLAGDGVLTMEEIARILGRPYVSLPAPAVRAALRVLKRLGLTRYGPEQVGFLQYRPVLSNRRLKSEFGYVPQKTTREAFLYYLKERG